jgi:RNA polymerase sigma-70 factor (ECF subfamily)
VARPRPAGSRNEYPSGTWPVWSVGWPGARKPPSRALYEQVAGTVYGVLRSVARDPTLAEDVTQDVLVEVWRTASRFDPRRGSRMAWIVAPTGAGRLAL